MSNSCSLLAGFVLSFCQGGSCIQVLLRVIGTDGLWHVDDKNCGVRGEGGWGWGGWLKGEDQRPKVLGFGASTCPFSGAMDTSACRSST